MSREDLRRFANRPWRQIAAAKERHWRRRKHGLSIADVWRAGAELRSHVRSVTHRGPSLAERLIDVQSHQRVGEALRAVTRAAR